MIPFPDKKYNIIYADPPWSYKVWTAKGGHKSASAHYNVMDIEDIKSLRVMAVPFNKLGKILIIKFISISNLC